MKPPYWKKYEAKWPERVKVSRKAYYLKNKERIGAAVRKWRQANRETYLEQKRQYYMETKGVSRLKPRKRRIIHNIENEEFYSQTIRELGL